MTDDQTVTQLRADVMPTTLEALGRGGTTFTNSFVSSPLCCPSRAGFLTGSYAHNNGVFDNTPGYPALVGKTATLFTWLKAAGYRTGHVGRFLLGYPSDPGTASGSAPPPGVDDWYGYIDQPTNYYDALFSDDGATSRAGTDPRGGYTTEVINREARRFVAEAAPSSTPFFLWVAHVAPHSSDAPSADGCGEGTAIPPPGARSHFATAPLPRTPSFNERDLTDKPRWVREKRPIGPPRVAQLRRAWRCGLASLTGVDHGLAGLLAALAEQGELDRTAIFFTSDNGLYYGEHRAVQDKGFPYEEAIRVPLLARIPPQYLGAPGSPVPSRVSAPVTNIDLTATILELAGASPCSPGGGCRTIDGRSLVPLLRGDPAPGRRSRAVLVELGTPNCGRDPAAANGLTTFYSAIRTPRFLYVELYHVDPATGLCDRREWELYDLRTDPFQLENLAVDPRRRSVAPAQTRLAARLARLRRCSGNCE